jgi:hypothetical protein
MKIIADSSCVQRFGLPRRYRGRMVQATHGLQQVRKQAHRRKTELEGTADHADTLAVGLMHKFHLGQQVEYYSSFLIYAPRGVYVVTAKLPERDGEFEYHIRSVSEQHERMVRESELRAFGGDK